MRSVQDEKDVEITNRRSNRAKDCIFQITFFSMRLYQDDSFVFLGSNPDEQRCLI